VRHDGDEADALHAAREQLRAAASRLTAAGARDELLARLVTDRRTLGIRRAPTMERLGRVWRLGVLLLAPDAHLYSTGSVIRTTEPRRIGLPSNLAQTRNEVREAARRAGLPAGETVNYDAEPLELDVDFLRHSTGPLVLRDGGIRVRWSVAGGEGALADFGDYLEDRVGLLATPAEGA
jgi:hypothetical protein